MERSSFESELIKFETRIWVKGEHSSSCQFTIILHYLSSPRIPPPASLTYKRIDVLVPQTVGHDQQVHGFRFQLGARQHAYLLQLHQVTLLC